jgi:hypothetical protein
MLDAIGRRITVDFRSLPAVFAFHWAKPTADRAPGAPTGFAARKVWHEPALHRSQPEGPFMYRLQRQVGWRWTLLLPQLHDSTPYKLCGTMITYDLQL